MPCVYVPRCFHAYYFEKASACFKTVPAHLSRPIPMPRLLPSCRRPLVCLTQIQPLICVLHLRFPLFFFLFLSPFLVPFKHFDKFNPSCVDVFDAGRGKNCFLSPSLRRGVHCDKSDSLIEQPSGLLDYFAAVWLAADLWTADWLPFGAADKLIGCLLCLLDVNRTIRLFVLSLAGERLVTEWFLQWKVTGVVLFAVSLGHLNWLVTTSQVTDCCQEVMFG